MQSGPQRLHENIVVELHPGRSLKFQQDKMRGSATGWLVWPVAVEFCRYLVAKPDIIRDRTVLELGSGTGVVGIACGYAGASEVLMTDLHESLPICRANLEINTGLITVGSKVNVCELEWGNDNHLATIKHRVGAFDLVLGSDIVYHQSPEILTALVKTIVSASNPNTKVLIAYEDREGMVDDEEFFFGPMRTHFKSLEIVDLGPGRCLFSFSNFMTE
jgi:predicted nicotinamide N-methyase